MLRRGTDTDVDVPSPWAFTGRAGRESGLVPLPLLPQGHPQHTHSSPNAPSTPGSLLLLPCPGSLYNRFAHASASSRRSIGCTGRARPLAAPPTSEEQPMAGVVTDTCILKVAA